MLNCREFLQNLTPVEVESINSYIYNIYHEEVTLQTTNCEYLAASVDRLENSIIKDHQFQGKKTSRFKQNGPLGNSQRSWLPKADIRPQN